MAKGIIVSNPTVTKPKGRLMGATLSYSGDVLDIGEAEVTYTQWDSIEFSVPSGVVTVTGRLVPTKGKVTKIPALGQAGEVSITSPGNSREVQMNDKIAFDYLSNPEVPQMGPCKKDDIIEIIVTSMNTSVFVKTLVSA